MNRYHQCSSPLGLITIQVNDDGVLGVWFEGTAPEPLTSLGESCPHDPLLVEVSEQLKEYFAGERTTFSLPIASQGTLFQQKVWAALQTIPYGEFWSYQDLANAIDNPKATRAVGLANSKNPISIIVPCHRVIGKNGKLTGYSGGLERKQALLKLEGITIG